MAPGPSVSFPCLLMEILLTLQRPSPGCSPPMETDSSSQEYFGLPQSFVPWRAEDGLYDKGKDTICVLEQVISS